jgi:hypothetical protein
MPNPAQLACAAACAEPLTARTTHAAVRTSNQQGLALAKRENAQASGLGVRQWRCLPLTRTLHKPLSCD